MQVGSPQFTVPEDVFSTQIGDEEVLLHYSSDTYYSLNEMGSTVWSLIAEGKALDDIYGLLQQQYEVGPDELREDLLALVSQLQDEGLIVRC